MQGVWILQEGADARPARTKKEIREVLADPKRGAAHIVLERTSPYDYDGLLLLAPREVSHYVCGPDPYYRRHWYGFFEWMEKESMWTFR